MGRIEVENNRLHYRHYRWFKKKQSSNIDGGHYR